MLTILKSLAVVLVIPLLLAAGPAPSKKIWHTYPQPPKLRPSDPLRMFPSVEVPLNPERYVWVIKAPANESKTTLAPVYDYSDRRLSKIGNIPMGTPATIDSIIAVGRSLFYSVKFTPEGGGKERVAWVNGRYLAATALAPVQ